MPVATPEFVKLDKVPLFEMLVIAPVFVELDKVPLLEMLVITPEPQFLKVETVAPASIVMLPIALVTLAPFDPFVNVPINPWLAT